MLSGQYYFVILAKLRLYKHTYKLNLRRKSATALNMSLTFMADAQNLNIK